MKRKIIKIDEEKCNGCGACAAACHEGAIEMVNGKARLTREDYCDGLGNCLPACPTGAITFEEREAPAYDEAAVKAAQAAKASKAAKASEAAKASKDSDAAAPAPRKLACGCPGTMARAIKREGCACSASGARGAEGAKVPSQLSQWPVQIKLVPVSAPYLDGADLLIAADCTAYAYGSFHSEFIRGRVTLIGCPKLDEGDWADKLTAIMMRNDIRSVTIVRMEVPCCGGIERAAKAAIAMSGKKIPHRVVTISTDGRILD